MPLPLNGRKLTPKQLNTLVDDAVRGVFIPLGQGQQFEKALFALARNPHKTEEDIARVRDMTKYDWRAAEKKQTPAKAHGRQLTATHVTDSGALAANIRKGVYLIEGKLPISDIEADINGISFHPLDEKELKFNVTEGLLSAAFAYKHPALAH